MSEPILKIEDLQVNYGGIEAVKGISFEVQEGQIVTLIGSNGAGKSSTLRTISGLVKPSGGRILFAGEDITGKDPTQIVTQGVTLVPEGRRIFPDMTVLENVLVASLGRHKMAKARETAEAVIEECGLKDFIAMPAGSLNVLQKKRLEIARALATEPKLLLLDETMAGLSGIERQDATALIRQIHARGVTILMIEHVMEIVMNVSDKVVVLNGGKLLMEGTPKEVASNEEVISAYLGGTTW